MSKRTYTDKEIRSKADILKNQIREQTGAFKYDWVIDLFVKSLTREKQDYTRKMAEDDVGGATVTVRSERRDGEKLYRVTVANNGESMDYTFNETKQYE